MTTSEAAYSWLGKQVSTHGGGSARIHWTVTDHKFSYGQDRFLLEPVSGSGARWAERGSLRMIQEETV